MSTQYAKKRIAIPAKTKARLQQEVGSECPFCDDHEVAHFDYHHIDEDRSNSVFENLLMCCKLCHSKITKGEISKQSVMEKKKNLPFAKIELASISIDSNKCSWQPYEGVPNAFFNAQNRKSPFPILSFSFINHYQKTILLTDIHLRAKPLPRGINGLPQPKILRPSAIYHLPVSYEARGKKHQLQQQLAIPPTKAFQFQVVLYGIDGNDKVTLMDMDILYFTFHFGREIPLVKAPPVFINCPCENVRTAIYVLS